MCENVPPARPITCASPTGINGHNYALTAKDFSALTNQVRSFNGSRVERNFVGAGTQRRLDVIAGVETASNSQRYEDLVCHPANQVQNDCSFVGRRSNVQKRQLIGALRVVATRLFDGITGVNERDEAYPFDHPTAVNVETRNNSFR
jgi:hypothetical protein